MEKNLSPFTQIYENQHRLVRRVIFRISGLNELDDLVQEAFLRIWKALHKFKNESDIKTWIYRISSHLAIDHIKKKNLKFSHSDPDIYSDLESEPELDLKKKRETQLIQKALAKLEAEQRALITLYYYEDLNIQEIAKIQKRQEGTIKSRLYYARLQLLDKLATEGVHHAH